MNFAKQIADKSKNPAYMLFKIHDAFGVELFTREDLGNHTNCNIGDSIIEAMEKYHLIVMNGSNRSPAAQVEISQWFGKL